jgi:hypothetical protein
MFYESRCPADAGGLHDWGGKNQACGKCGLAAAILKEIASGQPNRSASARAYYDKYSDQFAAKRRTARPPAPAPACADSAADAASFADDQKAAAWLPDYTLVVRAAGLAGVTPATIEAIGSTEGREYADIVEGRGIPGAPSAPSDPRIFTTDAEVRLFLSDYNILRNAGRFAKLPPAVADPLAAAEVPRHEYNTLIRALPDVSGGYHALFAAIARTRSPADVYTFAIQSLCRMVLEVASVGHDDGAPKWAGRLGVEFAKKELGTILRSQKLFSKPGSFNWAVFETGDDPSDLAEQVGDVGEDIIEELLAAEGEEAADGPFSGENMDYDVSENEPNNEPNN